MLRHTYKNVVKSSELQCSLHSLYRTDLQHISSDLSSHSEERHPVRAPTAKIIFFETGSQFRQTGTHTSWTISWCSWTSSTSQVQPLNIGQSLSAPLAIYSRVSTTFQGNLKLQTGSRCRGGHYCWYFPQVVVHLKDMELHNYNVLLQHLTSSVCSFN